MVNIYIKYGSTYSIKGAKNWEGSMTGDGDRFSREANHSNGNKNLKSYDVYLKRKEIRAAARKAAKKKVADPNKVVLEKELLAT